MMCKMFKGTRYFIFLVCLGLVLVVVGVMSASFIQGLGNNMSRVMGIFTGLGASFVGVGMGKLIHQKKTAPEKLREEEIELKDERNVQIFRAAYSISSMSATLMFAGLVVVFSIMGSVTESYFCLAALLLQQVLFFIANRYYKQKM